MAALRRWSLSLHTAHWHWQTSLSSESTLDEVSSPSTLKKNKFTIFIFHARDTAIQPKFPSEKCVETSSYPLPRACHKMYYVELQRRRPLVDYCKKRIMCQRGWIKRVIMMVNKTPKVFEKSDESVTHKARGYFIDIIIGSKIQSVRPTLSLSGNGLGTGSAERLVK